MITIEQAKRDYPQMKAVLNYILQVEAEGGGDVLVSFGQLAGLIRGFVESYEVWEDCIFDRKLPEVDPDLL